MTLTPDQLNEIAAARSRSEPTMRPTVPALEALMHTPIPVLDHGFIRVIDYMGDDAAIVQAARVSYGKGTKRASDDEALIRYLVRHRHTTPLEMCEIKIHVKLPIFVARQWIRHRAGSYNEISARYSVVEDEFHIPAPDQLAAQSTNNRQGRGDVLEGEEALDALHILRRDAESNYGHYLKMLNEDEIDQKRDPGRKGLARELARMNLTLNTYTQWYWKTNLHNLFHFLSLRADPHAQYEIRVYADAIMTAVEAWCPIAARAFKDYRLGAVSLSAQALTVVKAMIAGETVSREASGMGAREWNELMDSMGMQK